ISNKEYRISNTEVKSRNPKIQISGKCSCTTDNIRFTVGIPGYMDLWITKFGFLSIPASQRIHHMHVDIPLIGERLSCIRHGGHVVYRAELGQYGLELSFFLFALDDLVPPADVCFQRVFPFGRAGVVHLRPLLVAYAGVDVLGAA